MGLILIIIVILVAVYYQVMVGSANAKMLRQLKRNKSEEQKRVIDYFMRSSSLGRKLAHTMSDEEYTDMVQAKLKGLNLHQKAIEKTGLDEEQISEIKPINLFGYVFNNSWARRTPMGDVASRVQETWIFFSNEQMYIYRYALDMDQGKHIENAEEFFYQDVTSFSTNTVEADATVLEGNAQVAKSIQSDQFQVIVPGDKISVAMTRNQEIEDSIQGMKQMLREKKNALK